MRAALGAHAVTLSDCAMTTRGPVWVDHRNLVFRRGLVTCLVAAAYPVAGVSAGLDTGPNLARAAVLLFEIHDGSPDRAVALADDHRLRLVGLLGERSAMTLRELQRAGLSAVLASTALTPARLLADGATTRDIAEWMSYSERTVKNIVHDVLVKCHGRTRAQAVAVAARRGVI